MFLATINVPGYLPMDDEPPTFDTAQEAWAYLYEERKRAEDEYEDEAGYTETCKTMQFLSVDGAWLDGAPTFLVSIASDGTGSMWGDTPGYEGDHDLGLAYTVSITEGGEPMRHLLVDGHAACTPNGDVREWNADAILTPDPHEVDCQRCVLRDPRAIPVEPRNE